MNSKTRVKGISSLIFMTLIIAVLLISCVFLNGCSSPKQVEETWTVVQEKVLIFSDDEYVDLWRSDYGGKDIYKLSDGTTLLTVKDSIGPDHSSIGGADTLDDLNEQAQKNVLEFYEKQGLLYDLDYELEKAYEKYLNCKVNNERFPKFIISQDILTTSSNSTMICFMTSVNLPIKGTIGGQVMQYGAVFNRETGEVYNTWDLFSAPKEEVIAQILEASQVPDDLLIEMSNAIRPEYFIFYPDNITISFPQDSLQSEQHLYIIGVDYDGLKGLIYDWAIPNSAQER